MVKVAFDEIEDVEIIGQVIDLESMKIHQQLYQLLS